MFFQRCLITILHNQKLNKWHPIFYDEHPFPGPFNDKAPIRFKSKGHHTSGFDTHEEALAECASIEAKLIKEYNSKVFKELDTVIPWDGEDVPADIQIRPSDYFTPVSDFS